MKRRQMDFAEVELKEGAFARSYRLKIEERVELEVPRGFDEEEVLTLLVLIREAEL